MPLLTSMDDVLAALEGTGLLVESHRAFPSIVALAVAGPVEGTWWRHPLANDIHNLIEAVEHHPRVMTARLIDGRVTFIADTLWPVVHAVGVSREAWQLRGLSDLGSRLFAEVEERGETRTDVLAVAWALPTRPVSEAARELERRLLVRGQSVHTERGAHAKVLKSWPSWAARIGYSPPLLAAEDARRLLEERIGAINARFGSTARAPWQVGARRGHG